MTLKELRKKYIGKLIDEDSLNDDFCLDETDDGYLLSFCSGDVLVHSATITLSSDMQILAISRLSAKMLIGEDATSSNYAPTRVDADDYDFLDDALEDCVCDMDE